MGPKVRELHQLLLEARRDLGQSFLAIVILRSAMLFSMYGSSGFFNILISKWQDHARLDLDLLVDLLLDLPLHAHCHHETTFPSILLAPTFSTLSYELSVTSSNVSPQSCLMKPEVTLVHGLDVVLQIVR